MDLLARIGAAFPGGPPPNKASLVKFDGFDQPAKEYALEVFGGKTRAQVAALVGRGPTGIEGLWGLEDLLVLEPAALRYYLHPFLRYLVVKELADPQDVSFWLSYYLSEILRQRGPAGFTESQRAVLAEIAREFQARLTDPADWPAAQRAHYTAILDRLGGPLP